MTSIYKPGPLKILFLILLSTSYSMALASEADITQIRKIFSNTNHRIKTSDIRPSFYCEVREASEQEEKWVKVDAITNACGPDYYYSQVYEHNSTIIKITINAESRSGDWTLQEDYYFHPSGQVAFIFSKSKSFQGYDFDNDKTIDNPPYTIEERIYFDINGNMIRELSKAFSSKNEVIDVRYLRSISIERFNKLQEFPFLYKDQ